MFDLPKIRIERLISNLYNKEKKIEGNSYHSDQYGTLVARSKPSKAVIIVDSLNKITPVFINLKCSEKPYDITIKKEGYCDYTEKLIIKSGTKIEIKAILKKKRK